MAKAGFGINCAIYAPVEIHTSRILAREEWIAFIRSRNAQYKCQGNHQIFRIHAKSAPDMLAYNCSYLGKGKPNDEFYNDLWCWLKTLPEAFPEGGTPLEEDLSLNTRNI